MSRIIKTNGKRFVRSNSIMGPKEKHEVEEQVSGEWKTVPAICCECETGHTFKGDYKGSCSAHDEYHGSDYDDRIKENFGFNCPSCGDWIWGFDRFTRVKVHPDMPKWYAERIKS